MKEVREKEGLTYGVYSFLGGLEEGKDGFFVAWGTFASSLFKRGQKAMFHEIEKILKSGVTEDEVRRHRLMYAGKARVRLSDSKTLAILTHAAVVSGKPIAYLDALPKKILTVSKKEVDRALKKYITLENLSQSAAGPIQKI
jgi:zinc protease